MNDSVGQPVAGVTIENGCEDAVLVNPKPGATSKEILSAVYPGG